MTQWAPDTCGCVFEVAEDWKSAKQINVCHHHNTAPDPFVAVRNENAFKNVACSEVATAIVVDPTTVFGYYDPLSGLIVQTPKGTTLTALLKAQAAVDTSLGVNSAKVI